MCAGFQNPFENFQNPFQGFTGAPRPQPEDFTVPGPVITPGVSVNPHAGFEFKPTYTPEGQPAGIVPYSATPALGQSDAPTYQQRGEDTVDAQKYSDELEKWKLLENERRKRLSMMMKLLGSFGNSGGGSTASSSGGRPAPKVGSAGSLELVDMGVSGKPEDPFPGLDDFYPFLARYRK